MNIDEEADFELPKIRIKLELSEDLHQAQKPDKNLADESQNAPDLLEILKGIDMTAS